MSKKEMRTVTIQMSKWLRGTDVMDSHLWNSEMKMGCCLGHVCHQLYGTPYTALNHKGMPEELAGLPGFKKTNELIEIGKEDGYPYGALNNTLLGNEAARLNDDCTMPDWKRRKRLQTLFRGHGIRLVFVKDEEFKQTRKRLEECAEECL